MSFKESLFTPLHRRIGISIISIRLWFSGCRRIGGCDKEPQFELHRDYNSPQECTIMVCRREGFAKYFWPAGMAIFMLASQRLSLVRQVS